MQFGHSISISGDRLIVGARQATTVHGPSAGSAHIFRFVGQAWVEEAVLTAANGVSGDQFGYSVSISGDRAVVGAPFHDDAFSNDGSAYVFHFDADSGTWNQVAELTHTAYNEGDWFGVSVAVSGESVVVGAPFHEFNAQPDAGTAYLYQWNEAGQHYIQESELRASDATTGDAFGWSVAIDGARSLIGARLEDRPPLTNAGAAYLFERDSITGVWAQRYKLTLPNAAGGDLFGHSVALWQHRAVVGAPFDDTAAGIDAGSAYVFNLTGSTAQGQILAPDGSTNDQFGTSVAISSDFVAIGSPLDDLPGAADAGSAWMFGLKGSTWIPFGQIIASNASAGDQSGMSISMSVTTVAMGLPLGDGLGGPDRGGAHLYTGGPAIDRQPRAEIEETGASQASFSVITTGYYPVAFQWRRGEENVMDGPSAGGGTIIGAQTTAMIIANPGALDAGEYFCLVTDECGTSRSAAATLTVHAAPCDGDFSGNGAIDFADITAVLALWGAGCP